MIQNFLFGLGIGILTMGIILYIKGNTPVRNSNTRRPRYTRINQPQIEYSPSTISNDSNQQCFDESGSVCSICLVEIKKDDVSFLPCTHSFHTNCFMELQKHAYKSCPLCKAEFA